MPLHENPMPTPVRPVPVGRVLDWQLSAPGETAGAIWVTIRQLN